VRQAFHILRKDVRYLWLEISIALAATGAFTSVVASGAQSLNDPAAVQGVAATLLTYLVPVAWSALIARLIYAEPLAGNQQVWVTRPYAWKSLLAAKALFIAVFINLPKLIGDTVILRAYGFEIDSELGGLLWTQVLLTAVLVLPVAALSAVTTGFVQLLAVTLLLVLAVAGWNLVIPTAGDPWLALEWTRSYSTGLVVAAGALAIMLWQYARRDTATSRFLAGGAVLMAFAVFVWLPWPAAFALQSRFSTQAIDTSAVRIEFDPNTEFAARALVDEDSSADLDILLRVTGVPAPLKPVVEGIVAEIEGPDGAEWRTGQNPRSHVRSNQAAQPWATASVEPSRPRVDSSTSFRARLDSSFYRKVKEGPVQIRGSLYLTLYGNPRLTSLPIRAEPVLVPTAGVGLCSAAPRRNRGIVLNCRSAFRSRPDLVTYGFEKRWIGGPPAVLLPLSDPRPVSYSPFPADLNLIPVSQFALHDPMIILRSISGVNVQAEEPVAHINRDFEITGLRLADYEVSR
jgi:hypothetical protein